MSVSVIHRPYGLAMALPTPLLRSLRKFSGRLRVISSRPKGQIKKGQAAAAARRRLRPYRPTEATGNGCLAAAGLGPKTRVCHDQRPETKHHDSNPDTRLPLELRYISPVVAIFRNFLKHINQSTITINRTNTAARTPTLNPLH